MAEKKSPSREVIYIELDDEVTSIFDRVKSVRKKNIVLVVPSRAAILQSLVNLKILKFKSKSAEKEITIATRDAAGRRIADSAGFATAENVKIQNKKVEIEGEKIPEIEKIEAHKNSDTLEKKPTKMNRRRLTIADVADDAKEKLKKISREEIPLGNIHPISGAQNLWHKFFGGVDEDSENSNVNFVVRAPSRKILMMFAGAAIALLFFVIYIAVPTATVHITPRADPISKTVNVSFLARDAIAAPLTEGTHSLAAEFIDYELDRPIRIGATGQIFDGVNSTGVVKIYNRSPKDKFIIPSRFKSSNGLIFHTKKALTIPRAIGDTPGSVIAEMEACETDDPNCDCINEPEECRGNFVGADGNIDPSFFTMPAIPSLSPSLYWAESDQPFVGGVTNVTKYVTTEDIENVKKTATREIELQTKADIQALIDEQNSATGSQLTLLPNSVSVEILELEVPDDVIGQEIDEFEVGVKARVSAVAFEKDDLRNLLQKQLATKVHPEKVLTEVDFDGATYRLEEVDREERAAKSAITIAGVEEYDISEITVVGNRLTENIRQRILGKPVDDAEKFVRNLPEVSEATISSWPFWARTIPEIPENVNFRAD